MRPFLYQNYVNINHSLNRIIEGELDTKVDEYSTKEFSELSDDINSTVKSLKDYMNREQERIKQELELAKNIQMNALPMLRAMEEMRSSGMVKYLGFTTKDTNDVVFDFIRSRKFDTVQMCYNLLFQHPYDPSRPFGSMLEADKQGMGIITMRTVTSDMFQRWVQMVNPENTFDYNRALIQFVLSNPLVDVALVGMRTKELVLSNVEIIEDLDGRIDLMELHEKFV